jgi:hypothetical protein
LGLARLSDLRGIKLGDTTGAGAALTTEYRAKLAINKELIILFI